MKPVVSAWYAQFRVDAGGKRGSVTPCLNVPSVRATVPVKRHSQPSRRTGQATDTGPLADSGRRSMAWPTRPCFRGDPFLCADVLPTWYFGPCTKRIENPRRGAMLCAAVACLAWDGWIGDLRGAALAGAAL